MLVIDNTTPLHASVSTSRSEIMIGWQHNLQTQVLWCTHFPLALTSAGMYIVSSVACVHIDLGIGYRSSLNLTCDHFSSLTNSAWIHHNYVCNPDQNHVIPCLNFSNNVSKGNVPEAIKKIKIKIVNANA